MSSKKKKLKNVSTNSLSRQFSLAKLTLQTGSRLALNTFRKDKKLTDADYKKLVDIWTKELGKLKGSLMKVGQMLSVFGEYFLPEHANEILKSLQFESPPLEWQAMEKHLKKVLPQYTDLEIDPEPVGSASIGQVHRAICKKTGVELALKIQYPGIKKAIDSDLKILRNFLSFWKVLPDKERANYLFDEVRSMLYQEMDYEQELQFTQTYYDQLKDNPRFVVARPHPEYCSKKVLATEFIHAEKVDSPAVRALSQERRNRLSEEFLELYFRELFVWQNVQTDPHFGNYRIQIDENGDCDRIVLFDFGAMRAIDDDFIHAYKRFIASALYDRPATFSIAAENLRILKANDTDEQREFLRGMCSLIIEPFLDKKDSKGKPFYNDQGEYLFGNSDLPNRCIKLGPQIFKMFPLRLPPHEFLFLDRKLAGTYTFLARLDAKLYARPLLVKYVK